MPILSLKEVYDIGVGAYASSGSRTGMRASQWGSISAPTIPSVGTEWSLSFWAKEYGGLNTTTNFKLNGQFEITFSDNGNFTFKIYDNGGWVSAITINVVEEEWTHIAVVNNGGSLKVYRNNILQKYPKFKRGD